MKMQVNISKNKVLFTILTIMILGGVVFAYAFSNSGTGGTPAVFGHSIDEIDWSKIIPVINVKNINASQTNTSTLCLNGDCKNAWPAPVPGGNTVVTCSIPNGGSCFLNCPAGYSASNVQTSCSGGNVQPLAAGGYSCQSPTTIGCSCSATCTQIPAGNTWNVNCPTNQVLKGLTSSGTPTCVVDQTAVVPNTCTWSGRVYSSGATCWSSGQCGGNQDTTIQHCNSGSWSSSVVRTQTPCPYSSC